MHGLRVPEAPSPDSRLTQRLRRGLSQRYPQGFEAAGRLLRAPGCHFRNPKEERCRPRWQVPEARSKAAVFHPAVSRAPRQLGRGRRIFVVFSLIRHYLTTGY